MCLCSGQSAACNHVKRQNAMLIISLVLSAFMYFFPSHAIPSRIKPEHPFRIGVFFSRGYLHDCQLCVCALSSCNFFLTTPCTSWRIKRQNLMRFVEWQREQKCIMPSTFYIQFWFCIRESRWWFFLYIYSSSSPRSLLLHLARICNGKREKNVYQAKYIVKKNQTNEIHHLCRWCCWLLLLL